MIDAEILARSGEGWKSGPMGLAVILVLCVACYFLFKSMSKHMRKVREEFPTEVPDRRSPGKVADPRTAADAERPATPAQSDAPAPDTEFRT